MRGYLRVCKRDGGEMGATNVDCIFLNEYIQRKEIPILKQKYLIIMRLPSLNVPHSDGPLVHFVSILSTLHVRHSNNILISCIFSSHFHVALSYTISLLSHWNERLLHMTFCQVISMSLAGHFETAKCILYFCTLPLLKWNNIIEMKKCSFYPKKRVNSCNHFVSAPTMIPES